MLFANVSTIQLFLCLHNDWVNKAGNTFKITFVNILIYCKLSEVETISQSTGKKSQQLESGKTEHRFQKHDKRNDIQRFVFNRG